MEKKNTILLTVIAVATLLVAVVGATFAYFTASVTDTTSESNKANVTTQQLASLSFNVNTLEANDEVYPGWVGYQKLTADGSGDGNGRYTLNMTVTGGTELLADMTYTLYKGTGETAPTFAAGTVDNTENHFTISGASFTQPSGFEVVGTADQALTTGTSTIASKQTFTGTTKDVYYIVYKYANKEESQNAAMGQNFTAKISASLEKVND